MKLFSFYNLSNLELNAISTEELENILNELREYGNVNKSIIQAIENELNRR